MGKGPELLVLVIATRNAGKKSEITALLNGFPVTVKGLDEFGPLPQPEENEATFEGNAYSKAAAAARMLGLPALADDSGLVVDALGGAPGVHSARYGGEEASDAQRCAKLLRAMAGQTNRRAAFACVLSIALPNGRALTYTGRCEGLIAAAPSGRSGFGYDPVFYYPPLAKTFAELTPEEKSRVSHRGNALKALKAEFDKVITWIRLHMPVDNN